MEHLRTHIVCTCWDETGFGPEFIAFGVKALEKHHGGNPRARVWIHAIQAISTPEQWKQWLPHVKAGLSEELFQSIDAEIEMTKKANQK